jgi:hypothetical protein
MIFVRHRADALSRDHSDFVNVHEVELVALWHETMQTLELADWCSLKLA